MENIKCYLCGSKDMKEIPSFWPDSMTTAGKLVSEPLSKAHCMKCGFLQRYHRHLGTTNFYEESYSFYERPGASTYDLKRYNLMALWIKEALLDFNPKKILDAGCGRGWMMQAVKQVYPNAAINGIEPSNQESENARALGFKVTTSKVESSINFEGDYDLVYATNVLEHTVDPLDFLLALKKLISDNGFIVLTLPDSSLPNAEIMFSDQNYSFTPDQVISLGEKAGLKTIAWRASPKIPVVQDKQLLILSKTAHVLENYKSDIFPDTDVQKLYADRCSYFNSFIKLDHFLVAEVSKYKRVFNFGTSTWTLLIAAYCKKYWEKVESCTIDGGSGVFHGKAVLDYTKLKFNEEDVVVLTTHPQSQSTFKERFIKGSINYVEWSNIILR